MVQFYIKSYSEDAVPNHSLCGFRRVSLEKGESRTVEVRIPDSAFTTVNAEGVRSAQSGEFTLYAGTSQPDALSCRLNGRDCLKVTINR